MKRGIVDEKMKLSKTEVRTITGLVMQRQELAMVMQEVADAEREMVSVMADRRGLPEGDYVVIQNGNGDLLLQKREEKKEGKAEGKGKTV